MEDASCVCNSRLVMARASCCEPNRVEAAEVRQIPDLRVAGSALTNEE
jgi:hypothetical protein